MSTPCRWMRVTIGSGSQSLAREDVALTLNDGGVATDAARNAEAVVAALRGGTLPELEAALTRLRQLHYRIGQRELDPDDWPLLRVLLREAM
jgi:hypothetical protein